MQQLHPQYGQEANGCKTVVGGVLSKVNGENLTKHCILSLLVGLTVCLTGCKDQGNLAENDPGSGGTSPDPEPHSKVISSDCVLSAGGPQTGANERFENDVITGECIAITHSVGMQGPKQCDVRSGFYPPSLIPMALGTLYPSASLFPFAFYPRESLGRSTADDEKLFSSSRLTKDIP